MTWSKSHYRAVPNSWQLHCKLWSDARYHNLKKCLSVCADLGLSLILLDRILQPVYRAFFYNYLPQKFQTRFLPAILQANWLVSICFYEKSSHYLSSDLSQIMWPVVVVLLVKFAPLYFSLILLHLTQTNMKMFHLIYLAYLKVVFWVSALVWAPIKETLLGLLVKGHHPTSLFQA